MSPILRVFSDYGKNFLSNKYTLKYLQIDYELGLKTIAFLDLFIGRGNTPVYYTHTYKHPFF